ncbi:MAG TPA: insulinase family protein [Pyrinomonadaceae bacterium]|jgi:Zn-dependent M16 (insulinase) family peptidase
MKSNRLHLRLKIYIALLLSFCTLFTSVRLAPAQVENVSLDNLKKGQVIQGFRTEAIYLSDSDRPMGGRFIHTRTGFTFDFLQIQSVPQAFMWVNSFPTSDMGEPHTQEHLLLGKGNKGRDVASLQDMSLVESNAFTMQWRTVYNFNTGAGAEVFFKLFERQMDALLHPDYTDEEIRREVRNFGVTENPADKTLRLEEKGSVYNEMVSSMDQPASRLFRELGIALYGKSHPLAYNSGGDPAAIRVMKPEDIRAFHKANYHLGNMGMVGSFPKEMQLADILRRTDEILNRLETESARRGKVVKTEADLPKPQPATPGSIKVVEYPNKNDQQPGLMLFAWPAQLKLEPKEELILSLFLSNVAGDATTNLYKRFVDTKTREIETGAKGVFGYVDSEQGHSVIIGLTDVAAQNMNEAKIKEIRGKVADEFTRISSWKDGSPELAEFNARLQSRIIETQRALSKFVNSPPGFGFRNTGSEWMMHLYQLSQTNDFRKSVTMKPELEFVQKLLAGNTNFWKQYIAQWKLTESAPYGFGAKANPELIRKEEREREQRISQETARLKALYKAADDQEAVRRYKADYDAATAELEKLSKQETARFVDNPPLTLDDQLDFKVQQLASGVPMVASTFDNMTSGTTGLALKLDTVPEDQLFYLSMLPGLLREVGVIENGKPVSYEEMSERLRKEILNLNASFSMNYRTGRAEIVVRGSGNNVRESERAVQWMKLILNSPDWRPENLPRIRDVVDQTLATLRNTTQAPEEYWVNDPADAYRRQDSPLLLSINSFMTRAHNVYRLRWLLREAGNAEESAAISKFFDHLGKAAGQSNRNDLKMMLAVMNGDKAQLEKLPQALKIYVDEFQALPATAKANAVEAAKDLDQILSDIPEDSLSKDWAYLCATMNRDLLMQPSKVLQDLNALRARLLKTGNARMFIIGSGDTQKALEDEIGGLLSGLEKATAQPVKYQSAPLIKSRLVERVPEARDAVFVGLVNPNTQGGVFLNSAPLVTYNDTDRESLLRYLASKLYGGGGAQGIFMKTWGAGLAYSNGLGGSPGSGRISYYAERTPELPQTLRFVIDELKRAQKDPNLVESAIAQVFAQFRSASEYEVRGEAMASDLTDGVTPDVVKRFRLAVLELRATPNLADELYKRMGDVYARVLPGYGMKARDVKGGVFYVIGPEKQLKAYEDYLKNVEGPDSRVYRIYPRDYWMTWKG